MLSSTGKAKSKAGSVRSEIEAEVPSTSSQPILTPSGSIAASISSAQYSALLKKFMENQRGRPLLSSVTQEDWVIFKPKYETYKSRQGEYNLGECFSDITIKTYRRLLGKSEEQFGRASAKKLKIWIDQYHGLSKTTDGTARLAKLKMAASTSYNRNNIDKYVSDFLELLGNYPNLETDNSEAGVKDVFEAGLEPAFFRRMVKNCKNTDINGSFTTVRAKFIVMEHWQEVETAKFGNSQKSIKMDQKKVKSCHICSDTRHLAMACNSIKKCVSPGCAHLPSHRFVFAKCGASKKQAIIPSFRAAAAKAESNPEWRKRVDEQIEEVNAALVNITQMLADRKMRENKVTLIDSGSNTNIIPYTDRTSNFTNMDEHSNVLTLGGTVPVLGNDMMNEMKCIVCNIDQSILSVSKFCDSDSKCMIFNKDEVYGINDKCNTLQPILNTIYEHARSNNLLTIEGIRNKDDLYVLKDKTVTLSKPLTAFSMNYFTNTFHNIRDTIKFFHESLGHPSEEIMVKMVQDNTILGLPDTVSVSNIRKYFPKCVACAVGSLAKKPAPKEGTGRIAPQPGEELVVDLKTIADTQNGTRKSFGGATHAVLGICPNTHYVFSRAVISRKHLYKALEHFRVEIGMKSRKLKVIRCDNELFTNDMRRWASDHGIQLAPCLPHEHHSIGMIERFNRTFHEALIKSRYGKDHITDEYWAEQCYDMTFKHNILYSNVVQGSPWEKWHGEKPDLNRYPVVPFGTVVMAHIPVSLQHTLGPKAEKTYCIGTATDHRGGLKLFNPVTKRCVIRRSFKIIGEEDIQTPILELEANAEGQDDTYDIGTVDNDMNNNDMTVTEIDNVVNDNDENDEILFENDEQTIDEFTYLINTQHIDDDVKSKLLYKTVDVIIEEYQGEPTILGIRKRILKDGTLGKKSKKIFIRDIERLTIKYNKSNPVQASTFHIRAFVGLTMNAPMPRSMKELMNMPEKSIVRSQLLAALKVEMDALRDTNTYEAYDLSQNIEVKKQVIGHSKIIFSVKMNAEGEFVKYKCRLVFRGDRWVDHYKNKTYSGTVKSESVRMLLAIAAAKGMNIATSDIKTAFLNAEIPHGQVIIMKRPAGMSDYDMPEYVKLKKCLYGLPMAPAKFREHSHSALTDMHFTATISDPNVYRRKYEDGSSAYIAVHVDDFLIITNNVSQRDDILEYLGKVYSINIDTNPTSYLGLHIDRDEDGSILVSQPGYIEEIQETYKLKGGFFPVTPMAADVIRSPVTTENPALDAKGIQLFQSKVGTLLFLANQTRPDILYAVNTLSRYTRSPTVQDMAAADRVLQYVAGTVSLALRYHSNINVVLYATVDASYGMHEDRKSHTGCTVHIGEGSAPFIVRSKKQTVTADSSTVAEFIATHTVCKEIMWARNILEELGFPQTEPTVLGEDNKSTICMIENDTHGPKTKHIDIRYNLIREQVRNRVVVMRFLCSEEMTSDGLTKAQPPKPFLHLRPKLLGIVRAALAKLEEIQTRYN